ncbi:DNA polymerase III, alpha subunit, partial [Vibrio parahaemolyticus AQ3810]
ATGLSIG